MSNLLAGKTALILGVANKWSLAYAIAQAFVREGGKLVLTYQGDRQKLTVQELAAELAPDTTVLACDVTIPQELENVANTLRVGHVKLDVRGTQHCICKPRRSQPPLRRNLARRISAGAWK